MTIGAFARAAGLSPKALRLYDELGLLRPAAVDPVSGYRFYHPEQLDRARLVAWLRRLGMPLARIRAVCDADAATAADLVAAYRAQVVAQTATRERLAAFLVDHLRNRGVPMSDPTTPTTPELAIRYAARSDQGLTRTTNEDVAYAGARVLAVADGVRDPGGDRAAAAAVEALKPLETGVLPGDLLNALADAARRAGRAVADAAAGVRRADAAPPVTTLTALLWSGSQLALAHIGDSRAYLLRGGDLLRITHDHTYVQSLVDAGTLSVDEAASHPQRALLVRALDGDARPDVSLHTAIAGDRYLLCSDGLSAVVPPGALRATLVTEPEPHQAVDRLIELAYHAGAPDNIACVVADVVRS